jgi:hypothetical protein
VKESAMLPESFVLQRNLNAIPKFNVDHVLGFFVNMLKTTQHIFSLIMITIEMYTVDQTMF